MGTGPGQAEQPAAYPVSQVRDRSGGGFDAGTWLDSGHILRVDPTVLNWWIGCMMEDKQNERRWQDFT